MNKRYFNTTGPCYSRDHYMMDVFERGGNAMLELVEQGHYFVLHAARQTGKTTHLLELMDKINADGKFYALYCSLENMQGVVDPDKAIPAIVKKIKHELRIQQLPDGFAEEADYQDSLNVLKTALNSYCQTLGKPLVIFFDEADCLSNGTLISFLRQLRDGFILRSRFPFVHSIALVGMRNLRDYKSLIRPDSATVGSSSPFNIVKESYNLRNFSQVEVAELYAQHTAETGQIFEPEAVDFIFVQTQGQPWLVNAIACQCVEKITRYDYSIPITKELAEQAIQDIVLARGTHFDSLMERLKEPRVRNIIVPLIRGDEVIDRVTDDYLYTRDLGLIRENNGKTEPANPIYAELIIRTLNCGVQDSMQATHQDYLLPRYLKAGKIDINFLIRDFQEYWRENSEIWTDRYRTHFYEYDEAAPHLVMQAFLQRVINSGGQLIREMALGRKRADLCIVYDGQKYPIEIKILRNDKTISDGLAQTLEYMEKCGSDAGWLIIFDRSVEKSWDEKIYIKEENMNGKKITVAGC